MITEVRAGFRYKHLGFVLDRGGRAWPRINLNNADHSTAS